MRIFCGAVFLIDDWFSTRIFLRGSRDRLTFRFISEIFFAMKDSLFYLKGLI